MPHKEINGMRYAFKEEGSGPLILFGHGLLFDHTMFDQQVKVLSKRARCISIDWPGHGQSGHRDGGWTGEDLVQDTAALIESFGGAPAVLVGLSQGGAVFLRLALQRPELVRALVVCGARPGLNPKPDSDKDAVSEELRSSLGKLGDVLASGTRDERETAIDHLLTRFFGHTSLVARRQVLERAKQTMLAHNPAPLKMAMRLSGTQKPILDKLHQLAMPTLVLWGDEDLAAPLWGAEAYRQRIPSAVVRIIPQSGHSLPLERPEEVAKALQEFLSMLVPPFWS